MKANEEPAAARSASAGRLTQPPPPRRDPTATGQTLGPVVPIIWLPLTGALGFLLWIGYALSADGRGASVCGGGFLGPSWNGGGQASGGSITTAAILGVVLWIAGGFAVWRVVRRTGRFGVGLLFLGLSAAGLLATYVAVLTALWYASPLIWGPRHC